MNPIPKIILKNKNSNSLQQAANCLQSAGSWMEALFPPQVCESTSLYLCLSLFAHSSCGIQVRISVSPTSTPLLFPYSCLKASREEIHNLGMKEASRASSLLISASLHWPGFLQIE